MPEKLVAANPSTQGRKRKQSPTSSMHALSSSSSTAPAYQQSTITDHFSPRNQSPPALKRSKSGTVEPFVPPPSSGSTPPSKRSMTPVTEAGMLDFGSQNMPAGLTSSQANNGKVPQKPTCAPGKPPSFQSYNGARKLKVKNLRKSTKNNADAYFNNMWESLNNVLTAIFNREKIPVSLEELYRGVENICRAEKAPQLFERLEARCEGYVTKQLKVQVERDVGENSIEAARVVEAAWTYWRQQLGTIRSIFLYLDRSYLFSSPNRQSIEATGVSLFRKHIAGNKEIEDKYLAGVFALFEQDRQNRGADSVNLVLLNSCVQMISSLGLYSSSFEPLFVCVARDYYSKLVESESRAQGLTTYIRECAEQLEREVKRCDKFRLELSTKRQVIAVLEDEMVRKKVDVLTDKARVRELLNRRDFESLGTLYQLLDRVGGAGEALKPAWAAYIVEEGTMIITDKERQIEMVKRLLDFKGILDSVLTESFGGSDIMGYSLRESFNTFINSHREGETMTDRSKPAEMIAKYVDLLLRQGSRGLPPVAGLEGRIETIANDDAMLAFRLELVLDLFRFIQGKDVFEAFYKKDLARRLLMGRSASVDAERLMLTKLKTECGAGFTNNLEAMFKDMDLSKESVLSFKSSKAGMEMAKNVELSVNTLSQAAWPPYPEVAVDLPQDLAQYLEAFGQFYVSKHQGRKLTWRHALSHCILKADFAKGKKELSVSAFQAVVLLLFNDIPPTGTFSYSELLTATTLPEPELKRTLQSMACGKVRPLTKSPKGREINQEDKFQINHSFSDPKFRVKINQIQLKETKAENKETHEKVALDRKYETQAAIIRIMKSRRSVRSVELVQQTIEQTKNRGTLDIKDIKQNIERLIEKDYMDRDEDNDTYVYIA